MKPGPKAGGGITCRCCTAAHVPCEWTGAPSLCTKDEKRRFRAKQVEVAGIVSRGLEVGIQDWVAVGGQGPVEGVPMLHVQDAKFIYDWLKSASSTLREIRTHVLLLIGFDMERLTAFSPAENDEKGGLETLDQKQPILASPSTSSENELSTPLRFDLIASTSPTYTMYGGRGSDHPSTQKSESPLQTPPIDDTLWLPYASGSSAPKDTSRYLKSHYGGEVSLPCGPVTPLRKQPAHVRGEGPSPWRSVVPPAL